MMDNKSHEFYMKKALTLAAKACSKMETPVGCVIVRDDTVIAGGYNQREGGQDVTLHAEMTAIREACKKTGSWRLDGCDMYVTLEPCIMCAGAIQQAKIRKVYFGAVQPKSGGIVSKAKIFDLSLNHKVEYEGGLLSEESAQIIDRFFREMRKQNSSSGLTKGQRRSLNRSSLL